MSYGYGGGGRRGRRGGRGHRDGSGERWGRGGGGPRGQSSDMDQDGGGRHPSHLKGREIGLWYARFGAARKKQADRRSVGTERWGGMISDLQCWLSVSAAETLTDNTIFCCVQSVSECSNTQFRRLAFCDVTDNTDVSLINI